MTVVDSKAPVELGVIASGSQAAQNVEIQGNKNDVVAPEPAVLEEQIRPRSKFRKAMILTALYLSLFVAALDATIVATAVPIITADLKSAAGYIWIGGAYLIANAAAAPIWVKFSDIWGRKPIFLAGIALFFVSSVVCAAAVDMQMLIVGRAIQGAGGGGLICMVSVAISDLFSVRERSLWLGFCEGVWALSGAVGPLLGGAFAEKASWRWCFWCNLPIAGTAFILIFFFLNVHNPKTPVYEGIKAIDWFGCISIVGIVVMLLLGLDLGGAVYPWGSAKVICLLVFGALMILVFIYSERKLAKYPVIPLSLFGSKNVATLIVTFFHGLVSASSDPNFQSLSSNLVKGLHCGRILSATLFPECERGIPTSFRCTARAFDRGHSRHRCFEWIVYSSNRTISTSHVDRYHPHDTWKWSLHYAQP